jgi:predicted ATP-dependent endonuclease of OLD family
MFIGKLFDRYDVNLDIEREDTFLVGFNGSGKTQTLNLLNQYFINQGENVLYFTDNRRLKMPSEQILADMMAYKLQGKQKDIFSKHNIKFDLLDFKNNVDYIGAGFIQLVNFYCSIIEGGENLIVLIDEPERNLHISEQYDLIDNIIAFPNVKKVIVATHSPCIINNRFDLCVEMKNVVQLY